MIIYDAEKIANEIGNRLKNERAIRNFTQDKLAELLNSTQSEISKLENATPGGGTLNIAKLIDFSNALNCSLDYILTGRDLSKMKSTIKDFAFFGNLSSKVNMESVQVKRIFEIYPFDISSDTSLDTQIDLIKLNNNCTLYIVTTNIFYDNDKSLPIMLDIFVYVFCENELVSIYTAYAIEPRMILKKDSNTYDDIAGYTDSMSADDGEAFIYIWDRMRQWICNNPSVKKSYKNFEWFSHPLVITRDVLIRESYRGKRLMHTIRHAIGIRQITARL